MTRARGETVVPGMPEPRPHASTVELDPYFEHGGLSSYRIDPRGRILAANLAELSLLGYASAEFVGRNIADFHLDKAAAGDIMERLGRGENLDKYPARLIAKNGSIKDVFISSIAQLRDGKLID